MDIKSFYKIRLEAEIRAQEGRKNRESEDWNKDEAEILEKSLEKLRKIREDFDDSEKFSPERLSEELIKTITSHKYLYIDIGDFGEAVDLPENTKIIGLWLHDYAMPDIGVDMEVPDDEEGTIKITIPIFRLMAKYKVRDILLKDWDEGANKEYLSRFEYAVFFDDLYNNTY